MKVLVYFQPKSIRDNFEGMRLRKDIKGACELNDITHTSNIFDTYDVAHFISINDETKISDCIEADVPVVMSALMCESDPVTKMLIRAKDGTYSLRARALRVLNKVDMVLVPTIDAKNFLINEGVTSQINVLSSGVNVSRFEAINENEIQVFRRYFSCKENEHIAVIIGDYDDKKQLDRFFNVASKCQDVKFYHIGSSKAPAKVLERRIKKLKRKASKNVVLSTILDDDLFRSSLMNAEIFLSLNNRLFESISLIEAMAARNEIFVYSSHKENPQYLTNLVHFASDCDELAKLINEFLNGTLSSCVDEAYEYAKKHSLFINGQQLKQFYCDLYKSKGEKQND